MQTVWEKFLFISSIATLTSYLDLSIGAILHNPQHTTLLLGLLKELKMIADAEGIVLSENIIQKTLDKLASMPYDATSSMHSDFRKGGKTEVDLLTGYVVDEGRKLGIPTLNYEQIYNALRSK